MGLNECPMITPKIIDTGADVPVMEGKINRNLG